MKNYESLFTKIEERGKEFKKNLQYNKFEKSLTDLMNQYLAEYIQTVLEAAIMHVGIVLYFREAMSEFRGLSPCLCQHIKWSENTGEHSLFLQQGPKEKGAKEEREE